jgi:predicted glycosyltransferase
MKTLVDIGHPAHIHYFKNLANIMQKLGHSFLFVVRERDSTMELIKSTGLHYVSRGKGGNGLLGKLLAIPRLDSKLYKAARSFHPDLFLSFSSPYAAQVSWLMRKPHIAFDDTEVAVWGRWMYRPFTDVILSPSAYNRKLHKRQLLFDSFMDYAYLHPRYFTPNPTVRNELSLLPDEKFCLIRFVSWKAHHDVGDKGLSLAEKISLVNALRRYCRVFISSEGALPEELVPYRLRIHPGKLHDVLAAASLYIGEGATTATEACVLGTPAILVNSLSPKLGCVQAYQRYGLMYSLLNIDDIVHRATEILSNPNADADYQAKAQKLQSNKIDVTAFMVWFIEHYPESKRIMQEKPEYQYRFR